MEEETNYQSGGEEALFHGGMRQGDRIHIIRFQLSNARMMEDYHAWSGLLSSYFSEIYERLNKEEIEECEELERKMRLPNISGTADKLIYDEETLNKFERRLHVLARKYGFSTPDKVDVAKAYGRKKMV